MNINFFPLDSLFLLIPLKTNKYSQLISQKCTMDSLNTEFQIWKSIN